MIGKLLHCAQMALSPRVVLRMGACLASTAIAWIGSEWFFRGFAESRFEREFEAVESAFYEPSDNLDVLYRLKAGLRGSSRIEWPGAPTDWTYATNSHHLRGPEIDLASIPDETERILFLGDSYTFGWGVSESEVYVRRVEGMLRDAGRDVLVLNAGVPGFNTAQEFAWLVEHFDTFQPDRVIVGYVVNDIDAPRTYPIPPAQRYALCGSWLFEEVKPYLNSAASWLVADTDVFPIRKVRDRIAGLDVEFGWRSPRATESRDALVAMNRWCEEKSVPFAVLMLPQTGGFLDRSYQAWFVHEQVAHWSREAGIDFLDLLPSIEGATLPQAAILGDGHPSSWSHEQFALAVVGFLGSH